MEEVTDHSRMEVLSSDECLELLASVPIGRVAFTADGEIEVLPVTYTVRQTRIYFRSAIGSKLDAAQLARNVTFEADSWDAEARTGWSVVAKGKAITPSPDFQPPEIDPWLSSGQPMEWVEIRISELSGRRLPH